MKLQYGRFEKFLLLWIYRWCCMLDSVTMKFNFWAVQLVKLILLSNTVLTEAWFLLVSVVPIFYLWGICKLRMIFNHLDFKCNCNLYLRLEIINKTCCQWKLAWMWLGKLCYTNHSAIITLSTFNHYYLCWNRKFYSVLSY